MRFFLGTHRPTWLERLDVELMVSRRTLPKARFPRARAAWFLDSGGFTELAQFGAWQLTPSEYVTRVRQIAAGVGQMEWAAPMDWMCEPRIRAKTGLSVEQHQKETVSNLLELRDLAPDLPFVPVLQGWTLADYAFCWMLYEEAGVDLAAEPLVGLGTVCRRQATAEIEDIVLSLQPLRLHGFGVKLDGLERYGHMLVSADSLAWSFGGRLRKPDLHPGCRKRACQNCPEYAVAWRERVLAPRAHQLSLTPNRH